MRKWILFIMNVSLTLVTLPIAEAAQQSAVAAKSPVTEATMSSSGNVAASDKHSISRSAISHRASPAKRLTSGGEKRKRKSSSNQASLSTDIQFDSQNVHGRYSFSDEAGANVENEKQNFSLLEVPRDFKDRLLIGTQKR